MKNDIFNPRRFGKYFIADARRCAAAYGLSMALISFMGLITYLLYGSVILALEGTWESAGEAMRSTAFLTAMCVLVISMPVKCYGTITDKKEGSSWLMTPVSTFEKCLSMVIMTAIAVPSIAMGIYLLIDLIICKVAPTCGTTLLAMIKDLFNLLGNIKISSEMELPEFPAMSHFLEQMSSPWLYVDDLIMISLTFLLGAIYFKSGKTAKTILTVFILSMAVSMVATPVITRMFASFTADLQLETPENLNALFCTGLFRHAALIDTINDTLVNLALLTGIFFRVKTLKH